MFCCITTKSNKKAMPNSSGLIKHHNQGTYSTGKMLNTLFFFFSGSVNVIIFVRNVPIIAHDYLNENWRRE